MFLIGCKLFLRVPLGERKIENRQGVLHKRVTKSKCSEPQVCGKLERAEKQTNETRYYGTDQFPQGFRQLFLPCVGFCLFLYTIPLELERFPVMRD